MAGFVISMLFSGCGKDIDYTKFTYPPAEDRSALETLVKECEETVSGVEVGNKQGQYLEYVVSDFETAISDAKSVLGNDKATQEMVDNEVTELQSAQKIFLESVNVGDLDENDSNLVLHLRFSENLYDGSALGHKVEGRTGHKEAGNGPAPQFTTDRYGNANQAIHIEKGGHIAIPFEEGKTTRLNPGVLTVMFWIREPAPAACQRWIYSFDTYNISFIVLDQGSREFSFGGSSIRTNYFERMYSGIGSTENWTHIAFTYSADEACFYKNGELVSTFASFGNLKKSGEQRPFLIGSMCTDGFEDLGYQDDSFALHFDGDLDEFRLYETVLDADAVYSVFNMEKPANMTVDKTALGNAIDNANSVKSAAVQGFKTGEYLPAVMQDYASAIDSAQEMYDDAAASQNKIDKKAEELAAQTTAFLESANIRDFDPNVVLDINCDGEIIDESYLAHNLEFVNGTTGLPPYPAIDRFGQYDGAVHFDKGSYISIPYHDNLASGEKTYMFWIKAAEPAVVGSDTYLMSINRRFHFYIGLKDNKLMFGGVNDANGLREKTTDNTVSSEWQHVAISYSSADGAKMYVNGVETYSVTTSGNLAAVTNNTPFVIGVKGSTDNTRNYFRGDMDELLVFDRALSSSEIENYYQIQK